MTSAAELLRPRKKRRGSLWCRRAQAQTAIIKAEKNGPASKPNKKKRNNIKGGIEAVAGLGAAVYDFVEGSRRKASAV